MNYSKTALTNAGTSLIQDLILSSGTLTITYIKTGDGTYSDSEDLTTKTQLKNQIQQFVPSQVEIDPNGQIRIATVATNEGLHDGYHITEMGVFALDDEENEIMIAIAVALSESEADYMPPDDQSFEASINLFSYIKASNNVNVTTVSETGYAALNDYLETKGKVDSILDDIASVEEFATASKSYAVGDYLIYNDVLYLVTSAIAQGGTIITTGENANVEEATVGNKLSSLFTSSRLMQGNIAYVEDGETASKDYLVGAYLMRGGVFYKATQTIVTGDTLDPGVGGNITHVDVASQFSSGGGGGSTGCVELTQAQYDALSEESKMADVIYLITDSPDNYLDEIFGDFASVEYTNTASKAYAVGNYLVYDSKFYKVTTAIAQGGTITPGTNVTKTNVGAEIANRTLWWGSRTVESTEGSSGTLMTITDARITADHILDKFVPANGNVITSGITCTTSAGQALITGTSTATTAAEIKLVKKDN